MRFLLLAICILTLLRNAHAQSNDWSKRIISKTKTPLSVFINPHVADVNILIIDGKRFEHVRGVKRFYLPVPESKAIVFIVNEKDYTVTYHVFKMDTDEDIPIHAQSSVFGHAIGITNSTDTVIKASDNIILLCNLERNAKSTLSRLSKLSSVKTVFSLDLTNKTVMEKTLYLDKDENIIEERNERD